MSAVGTSPSPDPADTVLGLFRRLHGELRAEINGLSPAALNWVPTDGANSIATIVTHLVGSEAETLRAVAGQRNVRDREAEFTGRDLTADEVLALLDDADVLLDSLAECIDAERLSAFIRLPTLPEAEARTGAMWLVGNYGHAREHVGHIQLTKQMFERGVHSIPSQRPS